MYSIAVDLDGVLSRFTDGARPFVEQVACKHIPYNYEPNDWSWSEVIDPQGWDEVWRLIKATPGFWLGLPALKENVEALRNFRKATNHRIYYVTSRIQTAGQPTQPQCEMWLEDQGLLPCGDDRVIISRGEDKHKVYRELDVAFSIDDKPETVYDCLGISGHTPFLLDRRYNRTWQLPRVYSMAEFCGIVEAYEASGKRTTGGFVFA